MFAIILVTLVFHLGITKSDYLLHSSDLCDGIYAFEDVNAPDYRPNRDISISDWINRKQRRHPFIKSWMEPDVLMDPSKHKDEFQYIFCDDLDELYKAYFSRLKVFGDTNKRNAFNLTGRSDFDKARKFDLDEEQFKNPGLYSYVLLTYRSPQVSAYDDCETDTFLQGDVITDFGTLRPDRIRTIDDFYRKHGTHYINYYAYGGFLYQVLVYDKPKPPLTKDSLKNRVERECQSVLDGLRYRNFSPIPPRKVGKIFSGDGSSTIEEWATRACKNDSTYSYPNLLNLQHNHDSLHEVNHLNNNPTMLTLRLSPITDVIRNPVAKAMLLTGTKINDPISL